MPNKEIIIALDYNNDLMVKQIIEEINAGTKNQYVIDLANRTKQLFPYSVKSQLEFVFQTIYDRILFRLSPDDRQQLRTVNNIVRTGYANCTGYVTIIGAVLELLKIPYILRLVDINGKGFDHIYIYSQGFVLDACIGQKQDNTDTYENRPAQGFFNYEVKYNKKKDYPMLTVVQGTRTKNKRIQVNGWFDDAFGGLADILGDECKRECDFRYMGNKYMRRLCKKECEQEGIDMQKWRNWQPEPPSQDMTNILLFGGLGLAAIMLLKKK